MVLQALSALCFLFVFAQEKVQVKNVTPQGYVKSVDQVRIEFSQPMVKFGDIHLDFPAKSDCFQGGEGRWIDTKNWVYDFKNTMGGGKNCSVKIGGKEFKFNTGGPHLISVFPRQYRPIEPDQYFVLVLDSEVKKESLQEGAYFVVAGVGDRIPINIVEGSEANKIKEAVKNEYKYEEDEIDNHPWVVIRSSRIFPPESEVALVWSKEIRSVSGLTSPENQNMNFTVAESFKARFRCEREGPNKPCVPLLGFYLDFTGSIANRDAQKIYLEDSQKNKIYAKGLEEVSSHTSGIEFSGPFMPNSSYQLNIPQNLKDEDGRELVNYKQFPLQIRTGQEPSLLKFPASFGIVEAGPEAAIAVNMRRVEKSLTTKFSGWTGQFTAARFSEIVSVLAELEANPSGTKRSHAIKAGKVKNIVVNKPAEPQQLEVVGIPLKEKGFYAVEMESPTLGQSLLQKKASYFVRSAALVTDLAAHVKFNETQAWVWVTQLHDANIVSGVKITLYDVNAKVIGRGITNALGLAEVSLLKNVSQLPRLPRSRYDSGFFVVAEKGDDFTFTHSDWNHGIESWRFQLGLESASSGLLGHAILDRSLFKPEEKLSAKLLIRKMAEKGLALPEASEWPTKITISHESGLQKFELPVQWNKKNGGAQLTWSIPVGAKMGSWSLSFPGQKSNPDIELGSFSLEAFRVPLLQAQIVGSPFYVSEKNIQLQSLLNYFSGGPAGQWPLKIRWSVEADSFTPQNEDYNGFSFASGSVTEGLFRSGEEPGVSPGTQVGSLDLKTDIRGAAAIDIKNLKYANTPQRLRAEIEYKDPNGEIKTASRGFSLWPSQVILGIKTKTWWASPKSVEFDVVAMDLHQRPLANQKIQVDLYTRRYYSHRKRLIGGFYAYEDFSENKKMGELCRGETNSLGLFSCVGSTSASGSVVAVVRSKDAQGNESFSRVDQWIVKSGENQWFGSDDHDRSDLIPFKKSYEPGEVAELQLRTPFPSAKVLVTIERDRILHSQIVDVKGDRPVIKIPIAKEYAPNVVVSAFAVRGRLDSVKPTALVDLGKPSMKLGMANIRVGLKENTLKVSVETDRKEYHARQKSHVKIRVQDLKGQAASRGEVVIVAVDEGLLELRENKSWKLLEHMMRQREHRMEFATAETLIVGRRHFGLKALPAGGDGGGGLRRELFDSLLYWNPGVKLDKNGEAQVDIPLNDSTTSFRIVAIATQNLDQFGTGWTQIQSSQDLMILPGTAGIARQGDEFEAGFTVRNASKQSQNIVLNLTTEGLNTKYTEIKLNLAPAESKEIHWKVKVPENISKISYVVTARNSQGHFLDEVKKSQKILPLRKARVYQSQWGSLSDFKRLDLNGPSGAQDRSLLFEPSASIGGSLLGMNSFWENYSYNCLEQQISRAVALQDKRLWSQIVEKMNSSIDGDGLLKYFPNLEYGSVVLTSYVLSIAHEAGWSLPEDLQERMLLALGSFVESRLKNSEFRYADVNLRKIMAFETLSRYRRLNLELLSSVEYSPSEWPLSTLVDWYQIVIWEKNYKDRDKVLMNLESLLRNKFYFSSKRLQLQDESMDRMPWLMRDSQTALIRFLLLAQSQKSWQGDVPRLYAGLLARRSQEGHWGTTISNAWGRLLMNAIQNSYSKEKVTGSLSMRLGDKTKIHNWQNGNEGSYEIPWATESFAVWEQKGSGLPWMTVSLKAAVPVVKSTFAGFQIEKSVTPVTQKKSGVWKVGDIVKITLKVKAAAPQSWVVIEDPIPAGASVLSSQAGMSTERKEDVIRSYYSWFNKEETMEYTLRLNQAGRFVLPAPRVEAMYSPDVFAELPESQWVVEE